MTLALHFDSEVYSEVDLKKAGAWVYAAHHSTESIVWSYAVEKEPPQIWLPSYGDEPDFVKHPEKYTFHAHNAQFEFYIWLHVMRDRWGMPPPVQQWSCTAARAAAMGLPRSLENAGIAVGLPPNEAKDKRGKQLIQKLCKPQRNGERNRDPDLLEELYEYCQTDVIAERALGQRLLKFKAHERQVWEFDHVVNQRGIPIDREYCGHAIALYQQLAGQLKAKLVELTNLENPNSIPQMQNWLTNQNYPMENLQAATVREAVDDPRCPPHVKEALDVRLKLAKTPPKKYAKMLELSVVDGRAHGTLMYCGAHPGRWSGRFIQPHNLMRPTFKNISVCTELYKYRDLELVGAVFGDPMDALCSTVRSMIKAEPGHRLMAGDFSAVEGRGVAWQSGQDDVLDIYRTTGNVYEHQAAQIYSVPVDAIDKDGIERQIGKVAVLALGFEGGYNAFVSMGRNYGIDMETVAANATADQLREMHEIKEWWLSIDEPRQLANGEAFADLIKRRWRDSNPRTVAYWGHLLQAALLAAEHPGEAFRVNKVTYYRPAPDKPLRDTLFAILPSGRPICYHNPKRGRNRWGKDVLRYVGTDDRGNWSPQTTHGGKLCQNNTEGICRDILAGAMLRHEAAGYPVIFHVHDEDITHVPNGHGNLSEFQQLAEQGESWSDGFPLSVDCWEGERYRK